VLPFVLYDYIEEINIKFVVEGNNQKPTAHFLGTTQTEDHLVHQLRMTYTTKITADKSVK